MVMELTILHAYTSNLFKVLIDRKRRMRLNSTYKDDKEKNGLLGIAKR
jgi:hypothetical protein